MRRRYTEEEERLMALYEPYVYLVGAKAYMKEDAPDEAKQAFEIMRKKIKSERLNPMNY